MEIFAPIQHQLKKPHHSHRGLKHICTKMLPLSPISAQTAATWLFLSLTVKFMCMLDFETLHTH